MSIAEWIAANPEALAPEPRVAGEAAGPAAWFVLRSEPRQETIVASHVVARGFAGYLPAVATYGRCGRAMQWRTEPMFGGYLFVRLQLSRLAEAAFRLRSMPGAVGLVRPSISAGQEAAFAVIQPADIERMKQAEARSFERKFAAMKRQRMPYDGPLRTGDAVRVVAGAFDGLTGQIEALRDAERIEVLADMLGRATRLTVPASALEGVG